MYTIQVAYIFMFITYIFVFNISCFFCGPSTTRLKQRRDMAQYVSVALKGGGEVIAIPTEENGSVALSTLQTHFPGARALSYHDNNVTYGIAFRDGQFRSPPMGWGDHIYACTVAENPLEHGGYLGTNHHIKERTNHLRACLAVVAIIAITFIICLILWSLNLLPNWLMA